MKKLSDFKDENAVAVVADLIPVIMDILTNEKNQKLKDEKNGIKMFSGFFKNSPKAVMALFAILSEQKPEEYHCNAAEVIKNLLTLASDKKLTDLFTSQE